MDEALLLGLDVGTSAVKAVLVRPAGAVAGAATAPLSLDTPQPGWAEQDPDAWWEASATAIRRVLEQHADVRVAAVGISGQMHSSVFLDKSGAVIRPALLWCDGRTTAECREIVERAGGEAQLREWVCNPALEGFTLAKVLWLRNHEPAAFARLAKVLLAKDFVRLRLTGALATEPSDASGTLMFDPAGFPWSRHRPGRSAHGSRHVHAGGGWRSGQRVRGGRRRGNHAGGRGVQLGDVGDGPRPDGRAARRPGITSPHVLSRGARCLVRDGRRAVGGGRLRLVS